MSAQPPSSNDTRSRTTLRRAGLTLLTVIATAGGTLTWDAWRALGQPPRAEAQETFAGSTQWDGRKFVNPLPAQQPAFFGVLKDYIKNDAIVTPESVIPVMRRSGSDYETLPTSGLRISWLGHSTILLEIDGYRVLIDPVFGKRASPLSWMGPARFFDPPLPITELPPVDAVLISHDHYDHLDLVSIDHLKSIVPRFLVPLGVDAHLQHWGVEAERIKAFDWWDQLALGSLTITATPARHFSGRSVRPSSRDATLWSGWVVAGPNRSVYYSGDTGMFPGFAEIGARLGPFDATLIETGAYNRGWADLHIGPEQAIQARVDLGSGLFIPVHWGTFNLAMHAWTEPAERALVAAARADVPIVIPQPGQRIEPATAPETIRWWPQIPWQTAEAAPIVSSGL